MQYLARVRDGSRRQLRDGYRCCQVVGVRRDSAQVLPLYLEDNRGRPLSPIPSTSTSGLPPVLLPPR